MPDTKLQTILHVSDLHFGDSKTGQRDADPPPFIHWSTWLEGFLGHHWRAIEDLEYFVRKCESDKIGLMLVVSGDLTVNGAQRQFDLAEGFLGPYSAKSSLGVALGFQDWLDRTIPGNHDHWPGHNTIFGPPTQAFHALFSGPYPLLTNAPCADGVTPQYIFLDTDAEVDPWLHDRGLHRGRFSAQIKDLDRTLTPKRPGDIRILVLHHAILDLEKGALPAEKANFPRRSQPHIPKFYEIEPHSLALLEKALVEHGIDIVMSGHLHVPRLTLLTANSGNGSRDVFDARCGTTTQRDEYSAADLNKMSSGRGPPPPNSFILHELWRRDRGLVWEAQIYERRHVGGFLKHGPRRTFDLV